MLGENHLFPRIDFDFDFDFPLPTLLKKQKNVLVSLSFPTLQNNVLTEKSKILLLPNNLLTNTSKIILNFERHSLHNPDAIYLHSLALYKYIYK